MKQNQLANQKGILILTDSFLIHTELHTKQNQNTSKGKIVNKRVCMTEY